MLRAQREEIANHLLTASPRGLTTTPNVLLRAFTTS